ncbi:MAG: PCRF domain-containing protein [Candidatus Shikimatogenerans bostrichidophilus]|nr:MAG: PCRF domain-containing protein [Candidatus Shikimatogenerans bostrichidophilus]
MKQIKSLTKKIKKIKKKYKYIYNFIIGKKTYFKKKYNYKIYKYISYILNKYSLYKKQNKYLIELKLLYNNIKNKDNFFLEIQNDINNIKNKINIIKKKIVKKIKLINKHKKKNYNDAILEIRSGTGGNEACIFVKDIFRMYIMYFKKKKIQYEILNTNKSQSGYREVIFYIKKKGIYNKLKYESGVHRVQRIPKTETQGRLHTSAITVAVLPKIDKIYVNIKSTDIKRYTFRSSGAGGQHVNKTESAVRLIHIPTNITVECQEERSQHKNYEKAITVLRSKIYQYNILKKKKDIEGKRKILISTGDRSKKIRTYNYPQNRVTDHRINLSLYNLDKVMNGEIDKIIKKLNYYLNKKK